MGVNDEWLARRTEAVAPGVGRLNDLVVASAKGAVLTDVEGREILDFAGGIGVSTVGHSDESVLAAIQEAAAKLQHTCIHVATYPGYVELCEELNRRFPHGDSTRSMLVNSGAEAVENAVKIARQATGRSGVICYTDAFHGRTLFCLSLTSKTKLKKGMGPFMPEVFRLPYPNHYRDHDGLDEAAFVERELRRLRYAFRDTVPAEHVACVVMEPLMGEGGFVPCPEGYLQGLREICDEHGILLILDEVQSGFCRTGRWAAYEHYDVVPDLSTWAKAMGGGMPISAVVGKAEVIDKAKPGTLGGTYGGNPVSCAGSLATIRRMDELDLCARGEAMQERSALVGDVRGLGAMLGIELVEDDDPHKPATEAASAILRRCLADGVLFLACGPASNVIRLLPPLVISDEQLERGLATLEEHLLEVGGRR